MSTKIRFVLVWFVAAALRSVPGAAPAEANQGMRWVEAKPLHHYAFEGSTVTDSIGSAPGTLVQGAVVDQGALRLDGVSAYVEFSEPLIPITGDFSVSFFAQERSPTSDRAEVISQGRWFGPGFYIGYYPAPRFSGLSRIIGKLTNQRTGDSLTQFLVRFLHCRPLRGVRAGDEWQTTRLRFPSDQRWHHYALTVDSRASRFFIDGVLVATANPIHIAAGGNNTRLGRQYEPWPEYFHGAIAELWIYQGTLTAAEVKAQAAVRLGHRNGVRVFLGVLLVASVLAWLCLFRLRLAKRKANPA